MQIFRTPTRALPPRNKHPAQKIDRGHGRGGDAKGDPADGKKTDQEDHADQSGTGAE